jgi:hypothetical protein
MSMGGGGGGGGSQQTTNETILPDWVAQQVSQNIGTANTLASQPYQGYTGPEVAGFNADQTQAYQQIRDIQGETAPAYAQAQGIVSDLPTATRALLNPYLTQVEGDTVSNMQRTAAQTGEANAANAANVGAFGGTRNAVQSGMLASETQRNIGQAINQIQAQGWNTATGTALQQAQNLAQLATAKQAADLSATGALSQVGGQEQALTQAQYANALQNYQAAQNYPYQQLAIQQSALAGSPYGATVQSSQPYTSNTAAQTLGLAAAGLPIANQLGNWAGLWGPSAANTPVPDMSTAAWNTAMAQTDAAGITMPSAVDTVAQTANTGAEAASAASAASAAGSAGAKGGSSLAAAA